MRECLVEPIPACSEAAALLSSAVDAHLAGDHDTAARLISAANFPSVREFTESVWGPGGKERHAFVNVPSAPPYLGRADRPIPRMPTLETQAAIIQRDGYHCRFCGLPVIRPAVRDLIRRAYPDVLGWGVSERVTACRIPVLVAAVRSCLTEQQGGASTLENVVVTVPMRPEADDLQRALYHQIGGACWSGSQNLVQRVSKSATSLSKKAWFGTPTNLSYPV